MVVGVLKSQWINLKRIFGREKEYIEYKNQVMRWLCENIFERLPFCGRTIKQFPTVDSVIISINGRTENILQPYLIMNNYIFQKPPFLNIK